MYFRLALALGRTVAELERSLSHSEFVEWCAFYSYEPWGCEVDDQRWRQHYQIQWRAGGFQKDAPSFLQRYPVEEADEIDPVMLMLEARLKRDDDDIE